MLKVEKKSKETTIRLEAKTASVCKTRVPRRTSSLDRGNDWKLRVDLDMKLVFPTIWETNLRPDAMSVSKHSKMLVLVELVVPQQENYKEAHKRIALRY